MDKMKVDAKIIEVVNNYSPSSLEIRDDAFCQFSKTGRFHAELVCENEYGGSFTVAHCMVTGDPLDLIRLCREALSSCMGYIRIPVKTFE